MAETELLEDALALPESKKIILVERLLESLTPDNNDGVDAKAFEAELQRRSSEIDQGAAQLISWDVLKNESDMYQGE